MGVIILIMIITALVLNFTKIIPGLRPQHWSRHAATQPAERQPYDGIPDSATGLCPEAVTP
jgi:hypothetical protein